MKNKRFEDMTVEEMKQHLEGLLKKILQIIGRFPTPELRHKHATELIEWSKQFIIEEKE